MFGGNHESDKALLKAVSKRLERTGTQSRLVCTVQGGSVTLRGKLQYERQRMAIVKAIKGVSGVRNVIDQLQAPPKVTSSMTHHANNRPATPIASVPAQTAEAVAESIAVLPDPSSDESDTVEMR